MSQALAGTKKYAVSCNVQTAESQLGLTAQSMLTLYQVPSWHLMRMKSAIASLIVEMMMVQL